MSGLPPLTGFGGKWLLLSAMMEKGWYGPAVMTLLATFVGLLYMERFVHAIFFGRCKAKHRHLTEAPLALLIPQYLLVAGILVMSFFPKLLIEPVSQAIDPQFASTLVWQGMSLEMIYGYWNPFPVMMFAVIVSAVLFGLFWLVRNAGWMRPGAARAGLYRFFMAVFTALTPPAATAFWGGLADATTSVGQRARTTLHRERPSLQFVHLVLFHLFVRRRRRLPVCTHQLVGFAFPRQAHWIRPPAEDVQVHR